MASNDHHEMYLRSERAKETAPKLFSRNEQIKFCIMRRNEQGWSEEERRERESDC